MSTDWVGLAMTALTAILVARGLVYLFLSMFRDPEQGADWTSASSSMPLPGVGVCAFQGKRPAMEDTYSISSLAEEGVLFAGVFDGHGGAEAARLLARNLHRFALEDAASIRRDTASTLAAAFQRAEHAIVRSSEEQGWQDGSTAVVAVLVRDRDQPRRCSLVVGNVGDSRAIVGLRRSGFVSMSTDHKAGAPAERQRIEARGGSVFHIGVWRVEGQLAVSRAFGDVHLRSYGVDAECDLQSGSLVGDEFVIVATDGLWDVMDDEEATTAARALLSQYDAQTAASHLVRLAYDKGSLDNISCILIHLPRLRLQASPSFAHTR